MSPYKGHRLLHVLWLALLLVGCSPSPGLVESGGIATLPQNQVAARPALEQIERDLKSLATLQEIHYSDYYEYSRDVATVGFSPTSGSIISILSASRLEWSALAFHTDLSGRGCAFWYGAEQPQPTLTTPGGREVTIGGLVVCDY